MEFKILVKSVSEIVDTNCRRDLTLARTTVTAVKTAVAGTLCSATNYNELVRTKDTHVMGCVCLKIPTYGYLSAVREKEGGI